MRISDWSSDVCSSDLVRTDKESKPQEGISFLLIDMKSPGITVRPIITLGGEHEVNEVFLEDVRVPVEQRVYEENKGWTCAKFLRSEEHTSELQSLMRISYAVFCLKKISTDTDNKQSQILKYSI